MSEVTITPFRPQDLFALDVQERHVELLNLLRNIQPATFFDPTWARTAWLDDKPVACCGINRGLAWAFLAGDLKRVMVRVTREVQKVLRSHTGPVVTLIDPSYPAAVRWARMLNFHRVGYRQVDGLPITDREVWVYCDAFLF